MEHIPIVRYGKVYESQEKERITDYRNEPVAHISLATPLLFQTDIRRKRKEVSRKLRDVSIEQITGWVQEAGRIFSEETLTIDGVQQSPEDYCMNVMKTTGMPFAVCEDVLVQIRKTMESIPEILVKQLRSDELGLLDSNIKAHRTLTYGWIPKSDALCVVLPGNHPIVNMIWVIAFAMKYPVVIRPSFDDPFTPLRLIYSLVKAGANEEFFSFYPMPHSHVLDLFRAVGLGIIFGSRKIEKLYEPYPWIKTYGPGNSKIVIGEDYADRMDEVLPLIVESSLFHSGRACISASGVIAVRNAEEIAERAAGLLSAVKARDLMDPDALLGAMKSHEAAQSISKSITQAAASGDVHEVGRGGEDMVTRDGACFMLPRVLYCRKNDNPLFGAEYPFPFLTFTEMSAADIPGKITRTLACSLLSEDEELGRELLLSPEIEKLYSGMIEPCYMDFGAPHGGFLSDFLYKTKSFSKIDSKEGTRLCLGSMTLSSG